MKIKYKNTKYAREAILKNEDLYYNNGWFRSKTEKENIANKKALRNLSLIEEADINLEY